MTWPEFFWDVASNTFATMIGIVFGVPVALWIERRRQHKDDLANAIRRNEERRTVEERLRQRRATLVGLLDTSLVVNLAALQTAETEIGRGEHVFTSGLELQTWDVLKPQIVELIDDPAFVARLAQYFAQLGIFDAMVTQRISWDVAYQGSGLLKDRIVQLGPELRHEGGLIREKLRRFAG